MGAAKAQTERTGDALLVKVSGVWRVTEELPNATEVIGEGTDGKRIRIEPEGDLEWDSSLPLFLLQLQGWCQKHHGSLDIEALPARLRNLFRIVEESEKKAGESRPAPAEHGHSLRWHVKHAWEETKGILQFVGEGALGAIEAPADARQIRWKDFFGEMVEAGPKALPVVGVLSFLVGGVFAYETTQQLRHFGAAVYAVDALGGAVARQMAPILAAVIVAGRTGAAYAAHIGNMKLEGELDALELLGVSPVKFLALPRVAALFWIAPMLVLYADFFGILGGMLITTVSVHMPATGAWVRLMSSMTLTDLAVGLIKSVIFGVLVAVAGALRGFQCERTSAGVGRAATSAVVTSLVAIIGANAFLSPIIEMLGN